MSSGISRMNLAGWGLPAMADPAVDLPKMPTLPDFRPPNFAKNAVEALHEEIADFESKLENDHEIGMPVVGGPAGLCIHVREIYRFGSDKLVFVGVDSDANPVRLIQHLTQLNFLMVSVPKIGEKATRIGFHSPED